MTKLEYENKLSELSGMLEDLSDLIGQISKDIRRAMSLVDYLPELSEIDDIKEK